MKRLLILALSSILMFFCISSYSASKAECKKAWALTKIYYCCHKWKGPDKWMNQVGFYGWEVTCKHKKMRMGTGCKKEGYDVEDTGSKKFDCDELNTW